MAAIIVSLAKPFYLTHTAGLLKESATIDYLGRYKQWTRGPRTQDQGTQGTFCVFIKQGLHAQGASLYYIIIQLLFIN